MTDPRHKWSDPVRYEADDTANGCAQTERRCLTCGLVKITVHPPQGLPWTEWRTGDAGQYQIQLSTTPPCRGEARR